MWEKGGVRERERKKNMHESVQVLFNACKCVCVSELHGCCCLCGDGICLYICCEYQCLSCGLMYMLRWMYVCFWSKYTCMLVWMSVYVCVLKFMCVGCG
jgi:hypothetical protein